MTTRIWAERKKTMRKALEEFDARSPVMKLMTFLDAGPEVRAIVEYDTRTLVLTDAAQVALAGPVVVGIRYEDRFLTEAPHPLAIATMLSPARPHHPNITSGGNICCGHPPSGVTIEHILHLLWAGINLNLNTVHTELHEILNHEAADYVRARANEFPVTKAGLFEKADVANT